MTFGFHPEAEKEFIAAVDYYEESQLGLGLDFAREVYAAITRIIEYPNAWPKVTLRTRRCLVNRYPYAIIYQVRQSELAIIAVANLHRQPGYWKSRS